jgi:hypothetical protein
LRWLFTTLLVWTLGLGCAVPLARAQNNPDIISNLRVEQTPDGMYLSTTVRFELPAVVEEALLKGIAMTFSFEAQVFRDRWYWYDKPIVNITRNVRIAYQPLTRRWRLSLRDSSNLGTSLGQNFDSLDEALAAVRRISRWKIADSADLEADARHNIDFRFRLDNSQLPRPMQMGITGNAEWNIAAQRNVRPSAPTTP